MKRSKRSRSRKKSKSWKSSKRRRTHRKRFSRRRSYVGGFPYTPSFDHGKTYVVNGKGVENEIWQYRSPIGKYQHIFTRTDNGKDVKVYRHGNRWRIGTAGIPLSIVRNTASVLGRRMVRV